MTKTKSQRERMKQEICVNCGKKFLKASVPKFKSWIGKDISRKPKNHSQPLDKRNGHTLGNLSDAGTQTPDDKPLNTFPKDKYDFEEYGNDKPLLELLKDVNEYSDASYWVEKSFQKILEKIDDLMSKTKMVYQIAIALEIEEIIKAELLGRNQTSGEEKK